MRRGWRRARPSSRGSSSRAAGGGPAAAAAAAALLRGFDPSLPVERASTPPSAWYTSRRFARLEERAVFGRSWLAAARAGQLARPGDYVTGCAAGQPYVLLRDADGELRGYFNVCRHKGARLAEGEGAGLDWLRCPYHGWTYRVSDGRLARAERLAGIEDFRAARVRLEPVAVAEAGPLVFVRLGGDAPLERAFGGELRARFERSGYGGLEFVRRVTYRVRSNWKVFCDNYLDGGYHVAVAHPALAAGLDLDAYRSELHGASSLQTAPASAEGAAGGRVGGESLYAHVWPNLMVNRYGPWMDTNTVWPVPGRPDECRVVFDYYLEAGRAADAAYVAESLAASDRVQQEDIYLCESVQGGLASAAYDTGRYAPSVEFPMHHFHRVLHGELAAASGV